MKKFFRVSLIIFLSVSLIFYFANFDFVSAEWREPRQTPPGGNTPAPLWLSPSISQDGFIDMISDNDPAVNIQGLGSVGIMSSAKRYGLVGSGDTAGVRGIGTGLSSYGLFGQSSNGGYAAGFDGAMVLYPLDEPLSNGAQGSLYYYGEGGVYFCALSGGCSTADQWDDLIYGAWSLKGSEIRPRKSNYSLNGPIDKPLYINGDTDLQLRFNAGGSNDGWFKINNGENRPIFSLREGGDTLFGGNLVVPQGSSITLGGRALTSWDQLRGVEPLPTSLTVTVPNDTSVTSTNTTNKTDTTQKNNQMVGGLTLDGAYNFGGSGKGRVINASYGPVSIVAGGSNNGLEVVAQGNASYAGYFSSTAPGGRAVYGIATSTGGNNYGGYFRTQGSSGVGVLGEATSSNGVGVQGSASNGVAGQFSAGTSSGVGVLANGATGVISHGGAIGIDVTCSSSQCTGIRVNSSTSGGVGAGMAGVFTGGRVIIGDSTAPIDQSMIKGDGDIYVKNNIEVDGKICLSNVCHNSWPAGQWISSSSEVSPLNNQIVKIGSELAAGLSGGSYPLRVDKSIFLGSGDVTSPTGLVLDGRDGSVSRIQSFTNGSGSNLGLNPTGGLVSIGSPSAINVADGPGDLFVAGDIEVEGRICFKGTSACATAWPSSSSGGGGGGGSSDWIVDTQNSRMYAVYSGFSVGIGTSTPAEKLEVTGGIKLGTTTGANAGTLRWSGSDFEGHNGLAWVSLTASGGGGLWEDGTNGVYENDKMVIVGNDIAETLSNNNFHPIGSEGDLFVTNALGVEGTIFTDTGVNIGNNLLTLTSTNLTKNTGNITINSVDGNINVIPGGGANDYFDVDSGVFTVDSQLNTVGVGMQPDTWTKFSVNAGSVGGITSLTTGNMPGITVSATGSGNGVTIFSEGAGSAGLSVVSTNYFGMTVSSTNGIGAQITTSSVSNEALLASGAGFRTAKFMNGSVVIGTSGIEHFVDGDGDLYVKDELEVDGPAYFDTTPAVTPNFVSGSGDVFIGDVLEVEGNTYLGSGNDRVCINGATCTSNIVIVGTDGTNGNGAYLTAGGAWTNGSSKTFKNRFKTLDGKSILQNILGLTIDGWYYKNTEEYHIGPFAEDFYERFGTGQSNKYLAPSDVAGVALIGVQELAIQVKSLEERLSEQELLISKLEARLGKLEIAD